MSDVYHENRQKEEEVPRPWTHDREDITTLSILGVLSILVSLDATILVPALPTIADALDGTANETFWAGSSYLLANAICQPMIATLSDTLGRRVMLFFSVVMFTIGSAISCRARDFIMLLAGRTAKGVGGGGLMVLTLIIVTDLIPLVHRPKYYSICQMAWGLGTITGPLVGGAISKYSDWQWLFYLNFPFCAFGLVASYYVKEVRRSRNRMPLWRALRRIDWTGNLLFMAGTTSFLIGITWAGQNYEWSSFEVLFPIIFGVTLLVASILWEAFGAGYPFIRRSMMRCRPLMTTYTCTLLAGLLLYAHLYYVALFMMSVQSRDAFMTGVSVLPIFAGFMPCAGLVGMAIHKTKKWKWSLWTGWSLNLLGAGLFILLKEDTTVPAWVFILLVIGLGHGCLISGHSLAVQAIADVEDVAWASALFTFIRSVGLCLGVSLGGTILQTELRKALADRNLPGSIANHAESYIFQLVKYPPGDPNRIAITDAYAQSFAWLFKALVGVSALGLALSLTINGDYSIEKQNVPAVPKRDTDLSLGASTIALPPQESSKPLEEGHEMDDFREENHEMESREESHEMESRESTCCV